MAVDLDLVRAVRERQHWRMDGDVAVYAPPDAPAVVRVRPIVQPAKRERYLAAVVRDGVAQVAVPCFTAAEAVRWGERVRLT